MKAKELEELMYDKLGLICANGNWSISHIGGVAAYIHKVHQSELADKDKEIERLKAIEKLIAEFLANGEQNQEQRNRKAVLRQQLEALDSGQLIAESDKELIALRAFYETKADYAGITNRNLLTKNEALSAENAILLAEVDRLNVLLKIPK